MIFFGEGFRVFFLAAGIFAVLSGTFWLIWLGVQYFAGISIELPFGQAPHLWHAHEMIFGYAAAALGGFLLTAVPNWTGAQSARHVFIITASGIWLAGRVAIWFSGVLPAWLVAVIDLAFLPILAAKVASQLVKRPKPQNVMFLVFLTMLWIASLLVHLEWMGVSADTADRGIRAGLIGLASMIAVLGGRVTPAFTRNAMKRAGLPEEAWPGSRPLLERATIAFALLLPATVLVGLPDWLVGIVAIPAGAVQIARLTGWAGRRVAGQPILLSLHVGMAMLGVGLILWGLALLGIGSEVAAIHVLGIGAVGGMTIAIMSRATLGHAGRPLIAPRPVAIGYLLVALAALLRWIGSETAGEWYYPLILTSGAAWVAAFTLYTAAIWPIVIAPRMGAGG